MSRQKGGFGGYRGRRTLTDILRLIAVVLTVLVILVLAGLFFGQKYIVQTDRGLQFQLPQALRPGKEEPDIGDISVVIQPSDSERREEPEQEPERALTAALQLPLSAVLDGTAVGSMEEAGANALILQMKGREGLGVPAALGRSCRSQRAGPVGQRCPDRMEPGRGLHGGQAVLFPG